MLSPSESLTTIVSGNENNNFSVINNDELLRMYTFSQCEYKNIYRKERRK